MEYRTLKSQGRCSVCGEAVLANIEMVIHMRSPKHRKMITLCNSCIEELYNKYKEKEQNGQ